MRVALAPALRALPVVLSSLSAGCASVPRDAGFENVQAAVQERSGLRVEWRGRTAEDAAVDQAVAGLLQQELSADGAVQVALLNNRRLQALYGEIGVAQADLVEAGLLHNPVFSFGYFFPIDEPDGVDPKLEFGLAEDFLRLLTLSARKKAAGAAFEAARRDVSHQVLQFAGEVRDAYYELQASQQMLEMRRSILESTSASAEFAERLQAAGNITDLDLEQEQAQDRQARLDLAGAEADALQARERLTVLLGLWGDATQFRIGTRLPELPAGAALPDGLESLAVRQRLDLAAAQAVLEARARELGIVEDTRWLPGVGVQLAGERESDGTLVLGPGVELSLPLFDQGQAAVAAADARMQAAASAYYALAVEIRSEVRAAAARLAYTHDRARYIQQVLVPLRHRIVQHSQLQYNAMQTGLFDLLLVRQAEIEAGSSYIESLRDYWMARARLERALGGPLPEGMPAAPDAPQPETPVQPEPEAPPEHHHHGERN